MKRMIDYSLSEKSILIPFRLSNNNKIILTFNYSGSILETETVVLCNKKREGNAMNQKEFERENGKKTEERTMGEGMENGMPQKGRHLRHPMLLVFLVSVLSGIVLAAVWEIAGSGVKYLGDLENAAELVIIGAFIGFFVVLPIALTLVEGVLLLQSSQWQRRRKRFRAWDLTVFSLGCCFNAIYMSFFYDVQFDKNWTDRLMNAQTHTPVYTQAILTVMILAFVGLAGYLAVDFIPLCKIPPLLLVLGLAAMYLGTLESILWTIQVCMWEQTLDFLLLLLPLCCIMITARTVLAKIQEWKSITGTETRVYQNPVLNLCSRVLRRAHLWPLLALILMWPLLGILIGVLFLLGQEPDAVIKAWTETSDWRLSQRVAPQNVHHDEHYLCTVAAGGHRRIVKPVRRGIRHGHEVIVNRQLCIANAFEQVLEERTPRLHRAVRRFYDTCGFPVARLIHSRYTADVVYFLMKPLEWLFLAVLYLTDACPENRIAIQYTGKRVEDFQSRAASAAHYTEAFNPPAFSERDC